MDEGFTAAGDGEPVRLLVDRPERRNRLTVFFRLLLAIPQLLVNTVLVLVALVVVVPTWFAALALGRTPPAQHRFLGGVITWNTRVSCYLALVTDAYPPFTMDTSGHAVEVELPPPGRLNRLAVLGRIVMVIPAYVLGAVLNIGVVPFMVFAWFAGVLAGRIPRAVTDAVATSVRYQARMLAYVWLVTPTYPWGPLGDGIDRSVSPAGPPPYGYGPAPTGGYPPPPPGYAYPPPADPSAAPPPQQSLPPMPPMPPATPARLPDPQRYTGPVSNGARAILIIALVIGGLENGESVVAAATGHGGFGHALQSVDLAREGARFDDAVGDSSCPAGGGDCTTAVGTSLLAAADRLDRYADGSGATSQRARLGSDLAAFETEVRLATGAGRLVDGSGEVVDTRLLEDQTVIDHDVTALERTLD